MRWIVWRILILTTALILLAGVFFNGPILREINQILLSWIITIAGVAALLGIFNLLKVHSGRVRQERTDWVNSVVLLFSFTGIFITGILLKPNHPVYVSLVNAIITPVETSLLALLAITLIVALIRAIRPGINGTTVIFITSAVLFLWAATGFVPFQEARQSQLVLSFFNTLPIGGARGILLGVGLGSLTTGIRALLRPGQKADS